jgi:hypothetical protein
MNTEAHADDVSDDCPDFPFNSTLLEDHPAFKDEPEVKAWVLHWNKPEAIARRKALGFERGRWLSLPDPDEPFLRFLHFESASRGLASDPNYLDSDFEIQDKPGDPFEYIRTELNEAADLGKDHPEHDFFKFQTINSTLALATVHRWAKKEGKSRSHFYRKIADLIDKLEVEAPPQHPELVRILECFEALVSELEWLPSKDQLDKALNGQMTPEGPARTKFNRWLKHLGLDGLPPRKAQARKPGPVQVRKR